MNRWWIQVLTWVAFWMMVFWFGRAQGWHFSDIPPKPLLVSILGPMGFWAPMMYVFWPIIMLKIGSLPMLYVVAATWSGVLAVAMAAAENALFPQLKGRLAWIALLATIGAQLVLRLVTILWPSSEDSIAIYLIGIGVLIPVVVFAWIALLVFPIVALVPNLRRNMFTGMPEAR